MTKISTFIIVLLFSLSCIASFSQEKVQKYSKAKIYYSSSIDLEILANNGLAVDHGLKKKNIFIESVFSKKELEIAQQLGFRVEVLIYDMQKHVTSLKKNTKGTKNTTCTNVSNYVAPVNFELGSMGGFYTYAQVLSELDDMFTLYPNLITAKAQISNFNTFENRPIYSVKISDNPTIDENEPEMLLTAIHHAREPASVQQLIFYMWYLLENYATSTEIQSIIDNTEQFFIPVINVDGYIYNETTNPNGGGFWRKNRRLNADGSIGVDNNRNYSFHWGESGVSLSGSGETWPGIAGFSEPENQAVKWFCEQHNFVMALNNHSYSELLLIPYGYAINTPTPEHSTFEAMSEIMVKENGYANIISSELYPAAGDSDDWMYGDTSTKNKIYAMTPEIGSAFWPSQSSIVPICKEMLFHNITAAHLITNYAVTKDTSPEFINTINGDFNYTIKRLGLQSPANFTVSIIPLSANIVSVGSSQTHNGMVMAQEDANVISYVLDSSIQQGNEIKYKLIVNNGQFDSEKEITKIFGTPQSIFTDNASSLNNYNITNWNISTTEYYSAPSAITDSVSGNYNDNIDSSIELSNELDLTNAISAKISFYTKWNIESGWDYVQFEISIDNGITWIPQCGKHTKNGNSQQNIENEPMYDGAQNTWVKEEINISDYLNENIKFRFQIVSDGYTTEDGFYFDDFEVKAIYATPASLNNSELLNFSVYPNPFKDNVTVNIPNLITEAQLSIYSVNGQLLSLLKTQETTTIIKNENLDKGVYFIKIATDKKSKIIKLIKN